MATIRVRENPSPSGPPEETVLAASPAESLLSALLKAGVSIRHDCGGYARCGTCRVRVLSGGGALSPPTGRERARLEASAAAPDERLACQTHAVRDAVVEPVLRAARTKAEN